VSVHVPKAAEFSCVVARKYTVAATLSQASLGEPLCRFAWSEMGSLSRMSFGQYSFTAASDSLVAINTEVFESSSNASDVGAALTHARTLVMRSVVAFRSEGLFPPASVSDTAITRLTTGPCVERNRHRSSRLEFCLQLCTPCCSFLFLPINMTGELLLTLFSLVASMFKLQKVGVFTRVRHARLVQASLRPSKDSTPPPHLIESQKES
jgi:hypothetical protein